ncbi:helix-hairpin-helix domain-containing protein [candidate division WOR-3 bacterium]|nr:helix-hairpin-helix domain-containing protein [candidate division WOR-3 bacterium]
MYHPISGNSDFNIFLNPAIPSKEGIRASCIFSRLFSMPDLDLYSAGVSWTKNPITVSATASQFGNSLYREITTGFACAYRLKGQSACLRLKPMFLSIKGYGSKVVWSSDIYTWTGINSYLGIGMSIQNMLSTTYGTSSSRPPLTVNAHVLLEYFDGVSLAVSVFKVRDRNLRKSFSLCFSFNDLSLLIGYTDSPGEFSAGFEAEVSNIRSHYGLSNHADLGYTHTACISWKREYLSPVQTVSGNTAFLPPDTVSVRLFPADINRATVSLLVKIPGIGPVLARRIIDFRDEKGNIEDLEELLNVNGIGKNLFEQIKPYLTTGETDGM